VSLDILKGKGDKGLRPIISVL